MEANVFFVLLVLFLQKKVMGVHFVMEIHIQTLKDLLNAKCVHMEVSQMNNIQHVLIVKLDLIPMQKRMDFALLVELELTQHQHLQPHVRSVLLAMELTHTEMVVLFVNLEHILHQ